MSNRERFRFDDFTHENLRQILAGAKEIYRFVSFRAPPQPGHELRLRHDIDFSPERALPVARLEADLGISATYCVLLRTHWYNALSPRNRGLLRELGKLGHEVALHFDCASFSGSEQQMEVALRADADLLARELETPIESFSFHNPQDEITRFPAPTYAGLRNLYDPLFFKTMRYVSDSNGIWRHARLQDVLAEKPEKLCAVLHPEHWTEKVLSPHERTMACVDRLREQIIDDQFADLRRSGRKSVDWDKEL